MRQPSDDQANNGLRGNNFFARAFYLYYDGFRNMTWGKKTWAIIAIKLFVMFFILKLFFFPDFLKAKGDKKARQEYVSEQLINGVNNDSVGQ